MTIRTIAMRHLPAVAVLALCCSLASCGTRHADTPTAGAAARGPSAADGTTDDQELPDTTTDDGETLPDTTTDDGETLPDTTTDDGETLPDTTTDDGRTYPDTTSDDPGDAGARRWFPMRREFRAYLVADGRAGDAAAAPHVTSVRISTPAGGGPVDSVVRVDYGVGEQDAADRTAEAFARWRTSVYGDHGRVEVLGPAKTTAERDW
ncbi:hypothetical protein ACF073_05665 [Streptomyces sp. NPDC015171]|uniref:hypothetical protein n=1 Tax=Streptomyces sp. NPDC015171 TaxID=3364945 RepID=UPI0037003ECE